MQHSGGRQIAASTLALSILGFNLGIEAMQLFIVLITVPWLLILSTTPFYKWVRILGAVMAGIAALAWIAERSLGKPNWITGIVQSATKYAGWCIATLAISAVIIYLVCTATHKKTKLAA